MKEVWPRNTTSINSASREGLHCSIYKRLHTPATIRRFRNILRLLAGILLTGYLVLLFLANATPAQRWLAHRAEEALSQQLHTTVTIERLELGLFNRIVLHDVSILDQQGETLFDTHMLSAKIEYRAFLHHRVALRTVSLLDASLRFYREQADSAANYQFLLDAFRSEQAGPSHLDLSLGSLILRRCRLRYDERYRPVVRGKMDASHLSISDLDANISLKRITTDSLHLRVRHLALNEQSGLQLKHLSLRLTANRRRALLSDFSLEMPHTTLREERLVLQYRLDDPQGLLHSLHAVGKIDHAHLALSDMIWLLPTLRDYPYTLTLSAAFSLHPREFRLSHFSLAEKQQRFSLQGKGKMTINDGGIAQAAGDIAALEVSDGFLPEVLSPLLPETSRTLLGRLGNIRLTAHATYQRGGLSRIIAETATGVGDLYASLQGRNGAYTLQTSSTGLDLTKVFDNAYSPQHLAFHLDANATFTNKRLTAAGTNVLIDRLALQQHRYENIALAADWNGRNIMGRLSSADAALQLSGIFSGAFDGKEFSSAFLDATVGHIDLRTLGSHTPSRITSLSGRLQIELPCLTGKELQGKMLLTDFHKKGSHEDDDYRLSQLSLTAAPSANGHRLSLRSDFADADIEGPLALRRLLRTLEHKYRRTILGEHLPQTVGSPADRWSVSARLVNTDFLHQMLGVPLTLSEGGAIYLQGTLGEQQHNFLQLSMPAFSYDGTDVQSLRLYLTDDDGRLSALLQGSKYFGDASLKFALSSEAEKGTLRNELTWDNGTDHRLSGSLHAVTDITKDVGGQRRIFTQVLPTTLTINDTTWTLGAGSILSQRGDILIDRLRMSHEGQSITVDGKLSKHTSDSMKVALHDVDVKYILDLIQLEPVSFSGPATGTLTATTDAHNETAVHALLHIPDFHFNEGRMGDADILGTFNTGDKRLHLQADMKEEGVGFTLVRGYVGIGEKAIDLDITSKNTTLHFLRRYIPDIFEGVTGRTTGHCRIHGPFKALDFEGREQANVFLRIAPTGCSYHLSKGYVNISSGLFSFDDYTVTDDNGGTGTAQGHLFHTHLKDIRYDFALKANNLLVYDQPRSPDLPFYATAAGTGDISMQGKPGDFSADIAMRPSRGTLFTYIVDTPSSEMDGSLLRFTTAENTDRSTEASPAATIPTEDEEREATDEASSTTDIHLNFQIDMNPEAKLKVVTDEKAGNNILLAGTGALRATYYNKGAFQMFGTYKVDNGIYKLVIQDFLHKDLQLENGGTIVFGGDPYEGDLNIKALYTVPSVSLSDLGLNLNDNSVRADCILHLGGKVQAPQVTFDLNLPSVSEDVRQMVRQIVATEEDMNRQVLYLLGVGRFYNYNYAATDAATGGQSQSSLAMKSFLSSTLSSQINNIISNAIGVSDWTFGTNFSTGQLGWSDMEVAGLLSGRLLSGRLLVNGNFGYRDRATSTTNFVGNFDISYLLTPGGTVSLKAYSETNDRYFSKSSMTTQGIGLRLRRDFRNVKDLFKSSSKN